MAEFYSAAVRTSNRFRGPLWLRDSQPAALREFDVAVLAAIATRPPVTRAELAEWFGRRIGTEVIGRLMARDVITAGPHSPAPGAPRTLITT